MSAPTVVTEDRVTITAGGAMSSEKEIRESAGFKPAEEKDGAQRSGGVDKGAGHKPVEAGTKEAESTDSGVERDPSTGQFKPKADDAKLDDKGGDPRKSIQAKINEERRLRGEADRRAEAAEARAREIEARLAAGSAPKPVEAAGSAAPVPAQPKPPTHLDLVKAYAANADWPKLDDFVGAFDDPYAAMLAAQAAYIQDQRMLERDEQSRRQQVQQQHQTRIQSIADAGLAKYQDWDEVIAANPTLQLPDAVLEEFNDLNDPALSADVIRHILTHPEDAQMLAGLTHPIAAARAITRLASTMGLSTAPAGPETAPQPTTRAKPLIKPVSASPAAPEAVPSDQLPFGRRYVEEAARRDKAARR